MKSGKLNIIGAACLSLGLALGGGGEALAARKIQIGHAYAAQHPMHVAMEAFAAQVKKETKGELEFEIIPSGVLGGEVELIQQTVGGMLDASLIGAITMFQGFAPKAAIEDLPFIFTDRLVAQKAIDALFGAYISGKVIEPLGLKVATYLEHGFRQITNSRRAIAAPGDLSGLKLRVPPLAMRVEAFKLLGANPVPMSLPELFTALQQGTVDGQENPMATIESNKFYEVQKFISLTNHTYTSAPLVFNADTWKSFDPATQKIILDAAKMAKDMSRELYVKYEKDALARIKASGVTVTTDVDYKAFAEKVKPVWESFRKKHGSEMFDLISQAEKK
ncbi:DctP family TRAP transporter solute-binding subunit [Xanthobacteraceae bacterium Astr-EGSB]|uniref:DctP family TRAP transporter solute-binding subunit n=1 Tax=Astrobacterium formosum TaxID=3069710 RepID=UPI0027B58E7A|nr:DctP family TRAP transporter solute-binding subunit [Xanthobacteraceae bacterium Astr-EGSB]